MQNVTFEKQGNFLICKIDTTARFEKSKSGKSTIIASTRGITQIHGLSVGLNVFVASPKV